MWYTYMNTGFAAKSGGYTEYIIYTCDIHKISSIIYIYDMWYTYIYVMYMWYAWDIIYTCDIHTISYMLNIYDRWYT